MKRRNHLFIFTAILLLIPRLGMNAQTSFSSQHSLKEFNYAESSFDAAGERVPLTEGIVQFGICAGHIFKPVFRAGSDPVVPDQGGASLTAKGGIFVPIKRIGLDISGSLTHARFRDFMVEDVGLDYNFVNPQLTFAVLEFGFHVQLLPAQPLTAYIQSQIGLKFYTEPEMEFLQTKRTSSEFTAGLAFGSRYFLNPRLSLQLEYRNFGTFTTETTISGGTSTTEDLTVYTGIISLGAFFHLF